MNKNGNPNKKQKTKKGKRRRSKVLENFYWTIIGPGVLFDERLKRMDIEGVIPLARGQIVHASVLQEVVGRVHLQKKIFLQTFGKT